MERGPRLILLSHVVARLPDSSARRCSSADNPRVHAQPLQFHQNANEAQKHWDKWIFDIYKIATNNLSVICWIQIYYFILFHFIYFFFKALILPVLFSPPPHLCSNGCCLKSCGRKQRAACGLRMSLLCQYKTYLTVFVFQEQHRYGTAAVKQCDSTTRPYVATR